MYYNSHRKNKNTYRNDYQKFKKTISESIANIPSETQFIIVIAFIFVLVTLPLSIISVNRAYDLHRRIFILEQLIVTKNAIIKDLTVTQNAIINELIVNGSSSTEGNSIVGENLVIGCDLTVGCNLNVEGNSTVGDNLVVEGNSFLETLVVNNSFITVGTFEIFGDFTNRFCQRENNETITIGGNSTTLLPLYTLFNGTLDIYDISLARYRTNSTTKGIYSFSLSLDIIWNIAPTTGHTSLTFTMDGNSFVNRHNYGSGMVETTDIFALSCVINVESNSDSTISFDNTSGSNGTIFNSDFRVTTIRLA